jgi:hypothetical protein
MSRSSGALQRSRLPIQAIGCDAATLLVIDVGQVLRWMKDDVPWSRVIRRGQLGDGVGCQLAALCLEGELEDGIWSRVGNEDEPVRRVRQNGMRLVGGHDRLHGLVAERAILGDGVNRYLGGHIVCGEQKPAGAVRGDVGRIRASGHRVDVGQLTRGRVDLECRQVAGGTDCREEEPLLRVRGQGTWFAFNLRIGSVGQLTLGWVQLIDSDLLIALDRNVHKGVGNGSGSR